MKIVVTGALGHIGSALIRRLPELHPDAEIVLIDDLSTQRFGSLFRLPEASYRFVDGDVMLLPLESHFEGADVVVHLAAVTDAASSFEHPERVELVNRDATERVARACIATGAALLFLSTTSVYGSQSAVVDETCEELRPQSPYAEAKLASERLLARLGASDGLRFVTCRFGTIFGVSVGMRFHTAVNKFVWQACFGKPLTVWSDALDQRRPYLDLKDAVRAIVFIIERRLFDGDLYNVATANYTVREVVAAIQRHVPNLVIELVDSPIMNQLSYDVRSDKFERLGFEFEGNLETAIAESIALLQSAGTLNRRRQFM